MAVEVLLSLLETLKHPLVQAIQVQACLILVVGVIGWTLSGLRRRKEAQRLTAAGYAQALQECTALQQQQQQQPVYHLAAAAATVATKGNTQPANTNSTQEEQQLLPYKSQLNGICIPEDCSGSRCSGCAVVQHRRHASEKQSSTPQQQQQQHAPSIYKSCAVGDSGQCWPPLAVVLPVKGCRQHSRDNWATQLAAHYGGPRVVVFVVEAADDPAADALAQLMGQQQPQQQCRGIGTQACQQQQQHYCNGGVTQKYQQQQLCCNEVGRHNGQQHRQQQHCNGMGVFNCQQQQHCNIIRAVNCCQQQQQQGASILGVWQHGSQQSVLLVAAGLATTCSQKIHNIVAGIKVALATLAQQQQREQQQQQHKPPHRSDSAPPTLLQNSTSETTAAAAASNLPFSWDGGSIAAAAEGGSTAAAAGYVCILDDDVMLHPLSFCQMVDEMEADQSLYMVTGYPFDIVAMPSGGSSSSNNSSSPRLWGRLLAYAAASYHLPLLIGFSTADRGGFVWGGAMMLRAAELQAAAAQEAAAAGSVSSPPQPPSILQVWRDGGYSDDLLLAGYCTGNSLAIGLPASAYFPQLLPAAYSFQQYWNYLRRQLFVLDTYYSRRDRVLNHALMVLHSYGSAVFTAATVTAALQAVLLGVLLGLVIMQQLLQLLPTADAAAAAAGQSGLSSSGGAGGTLSPGFVGNLFSSFPAEFQQIVAAAAATANPIPGSSTGSSSTTVLWQFCWQHIPLSSWFFMCGVVASLTAIGFMVQQVQLLFGVLSPNAPSEVLAPRVNLMLLWLGWVLENAVLPYCMLYTFVSDHIVWGGIRYHKQNGKIAKIAHPERPVAKAMR